MASYSALEQRSAQCVMTCGTIENGDFEQLSQRNKPWLTIRNHNLISRVSCFGFHSGNTHIELICISHNMQIDLIMPMKTFLTIPPEVIRHRQRPAYYRITESCLGQLLQNKELFSLLRNGVPIPNRNIYIPVLLNTWADHYMKEKRRCFLNITSQQPTSGST